MIEQLEILVENINEILLIFNVAYIAFVFKLDSYSGSLQTNKMGTKHKKGKFVSGNAVAADEALIFMAPFIATGMIGIFSHYLVDFVEGYSGSLLLSGLLLLPPLLFVLSCFEKKDEQKRNLRRQFAVIRKKKSS